MVRGKARHEDEGMDGSFGFGEGNEANKSLSQFIEEGEAPVHLIVTVPNSLRLMMNMANFVDGSALHTEKMGHAAMIGGNDLIRFTARVVARLTNTNAHMVNSFDEAYALLCEIDESLPKSPD